jgi:fumigallin biosynthesis monooxygenase-like protein
MSPVVSARMTAQLDGDFVVFLIGMRTNKWWKFWKWLPVAAQMPRMRIELAKQPELGLLHARNVFGFPNLMVIQYWRSFEQLQAYATDRSFAHLPAWRDFKRRIASNGDVGIWHETFLVKDGAHEGLYNNMPRWGLANAETPVPAEGSRKSAKGRLRQTDGSDLAVN